MMQRKMIILKEVTWDNNPDKTNLEDGVVVIECLGEELLGDHDGNHILGEDMSAPSTCSVPYASFFSLSS